MKKIKVYEKSFLILKPTFILKSESFEYDLYLYIKRNSNIRGEILYGLLKGRERLKPRFAISTPVSVFLYAELCVK